MSKHITGQIVRLEMDRGFAIVSTKEEGDIFVHTDKAGSKWQYFADYAHIKLEWTTAYKAHARNVDEAYRKEATRVISVEPAEEFEVLTKVAYFDLSKGFGRVTVGDSFSHDSAYLSSRACELSGLGRPGPGMPIRAFVVEGPKGPVVTSFEWGPAVEREYAEKNPVASEEVTLKFFNRRKSFGFFIRADGSELHFHADNVANKLVDRFYHDKRFAEGARFKVTLEEYRGKLTAKVLELIARAPKVGAEVGEDEQSEPTEAVEVAAEMTEGAAEANAEVAPEEAPEKPKRAPRKPKVDKSAAEAKGDEPKAEAKPKRARKNGEHCRTKASRNRANSQSAKAPAAETPLEAEAEDLATMAKSACANGGGALAQAMLAAVTPAGNA